jgi:small subunit ribosomal protein S9
MEKAINTVGRRKASVARIYLSKGKGAVTINGKDYKEYFSLQYLQNQVEAAFVVTETNGQFDVNVNATGGGIKGQAEAIKMGIARALCEVDENLRPALKKAGMLRRDARVVERKKFGLKKARKSFQFSKR